MTFMQIFVLVVLAFAADALKWRNCDGSSPVRFSSLSVRPEPIPLRRGRRITIGGRFRVTGDAGTNYRLQLTLQRKQGSRYVNLNCFGFCTFNIGCGQFIRSVRRGRCPLRKQEYTLVDRSIVVPSIPFISLNGMYRIKAELINSANNSPVACLELEGKITLS